MRLLVVTQYFWPENFRINDLVAEMVARGHEVTVLCGQPNYPAGEFYPEFVAAPGKFTRYAGAEVVRVPHLARGKGGLRLMLNYASFAVSATVLGLWKLRGKPFDAILCYEPSPITVGLPAVALRASKRAPLTFWVLDLWPETLHAVGVVRSPALLAAVGRLVSFVYRRCDLILAQSRSFVPQIEKYAGAGSRIAYFPSWAEGVFDMAQAGPAPEVQARPDLFTVMFAGNVGEAQDFPAILAAAELLKDQPRVRWLIIGDGRYSAWLAAQVAARGLGHCFFLLGRHPVERMPSFFKHADALLVSLKDEAIFSMTIPGKVQSYLAAGIPLLAMLNGEGAALVKSARAGLTCDAGDHEGLAAAVLALAAMSREQRAEMGGNGLAVSAAEFCRDKLVSQLEQWLGDFARVPTRAMSGSTQ
ncbi:glycosyltransferase family 4 protein [Massilia glaciei]|uniref:Glycosyltransferase WbuB n=1 Tax=Massilia glaciei TaxID=1524097 RepID=A0A2U2HN38_9BURK|nr:glycosyltransferase family 4 protein [Massilia glaciei]PWF48917.1 glycosyltransferase WbuB [Massilia glaciei]